MAGRPRSSETLATTAITIRASQLEWLRSRPDINLSALVRATIDKEMKR